MSDGKKVPVNLGDVGDIVAATVAQQEEMARRRASAPSLRNFLVESPLYAAVELEVGLHERFLSELRQERGGYDCYCVKCRREGPFKRASTSYRHSPDELTAFTAGFILTVMECQRNTEHRQVFYSQIEGNKLRKIGQVPTYEDIAFGDVERYRAVMGQKSFSELHRAGGLAAFGIGIGAFVYLRRIFERMIFEHHQVLVKAGTPVDGFEGMGIEDKIHALRDVLPPLLVKNRKAYSILSLGIHELDEDFCREHFHVIRMAIVRMAEQDFERREAAKADAEMERELARVASAAKAAGGDK